MLPETAVVALLGLAFALAANALSPRGLRLDRDYFPRSTGTTVLPAVTNVAPSGSTTPTHRNAVAERLARQGLQLVELAQVRDWFQDPRYEPGGIVFVDARNDSSYAWGHIPGAWQFDHYRAERHLPTVLPVCLRAEQIVVYCTGGDCDDSEFAAVMLRDAGVPRERLFVYVGGMTEWTTNSLPVESGARRSGQITPKP